MLIEQAIMTYLMAQSGITGLVGTRIHYVQAPQDVEKPFLVVTKVSGIREHSHDGSSKLAHPRFQFSIFAETYSAAKAITSVLQAALQGYTGILRGRREVVEWLKRTKKVKVPKYQLKEWGIEEAQDD